MSSHTWKGWYLVGAKLPRLSQIDPTWESNLLLDAKHQASVDHPDTPIAAMMTPTIRRVPQGVRVMVVGKPGR